MATKYKNKMFVDYDRCVRNGVEKLCKNCTPKQQTKCQEKK